MLQASFQTHGDHHCRSQKAGARTGLLRSLTASGTLYVKTQMMLCYEQKINDLKLALQKVDDETTQGFLSAFHQEKNGLKCYNKVIVIVFHLF